MLPFAPTPRQHSSTCRPRLRACNSAAKSLALSFVHWSQWRYVIGDSAVASLRPGRDTMARVDRGDGGASGSTREFLCGYRAIW